MRRSASMAQWCRYVGWIHRTPRLVTPQGTVGAESAYEVTEALERVLDDDQPEDLLGERESRGECEAEFVELAVLAEVLADIRAVADHVEAEQRTAVVEVPDAEVDLLLLALALEHERVDIR